MKQVGVSEAKTQLARLLRDVERGETITITRRGRAVARLTPIGRRGRGLAKAMDALRESLKVEGVTARELIDEGRRR